MFSFKNSKLDDFQGISDKTFNTRDDIFVICKNDIPILYTILETDAKEYIKSSTLKLKNELTIESPDYNYYITLNEYSVCLWSVYKNWILSFDKMITEYSYHHIKKKDSK